MKPLGSITIDFPFLDESTRDAISSIMSDSNDYWDFSNRLTEEACRPDANQVLVFLALHHAERLENYKAIEKIGSCHQSAPLVRPFLISGTEPFVNIAESIESAVDSCRNDAIRFHLLMKLFFHADAGDPDELNLQRMLEDLLDRNSLLEGHGSLSSLFLPRIFSHKRHLSIADLRGYSESSIICYFRSEMLMCDDIELET